MAFDQLKQEVYKANMDLVAAGLVLLTWGNASGVDREHGVLAIKPSGVDYDALRAEDIVIVSLETGEVVEGALRPSSDTATHRILYREFPHIGGITHTHSSYATSFAQACREIPCLGTTHSDYAYGSVPVTRQMTPAEIKEAYEWNTGVVIVERFRSGELDPSHFPAVLVANHGPFTWGKNAAAALENAIILEEVAKMACQSFALNPALQPVPQALLDKHFLRKHGAGAYYGQSDHGQEDHRKKTER